jgi:hypothetical protein
MNTKLSRSFALLSLLVSGAVQAAAPANDTFEKATVLTGRTPILLAQTGASATANALDPFVGTVATKPVRSVWYRFDAPITATGVRLLVTDNSGGLKVGVFQLMDPDGSSDSLTSLAQGTSPGPATTSTLTFNITRSQRYYICVDAVGAFSLTLKIQGQTNDYFDDATVLAGNSATVTGSNDNASNDGDLPASIPNTTLQAGVWFTWTPSFSGAAVIDTNFSEYQLGAVHDTILAVYTGTTLANLVLVGGNDDGGFSTNSKVSFTAAAGTAYKIWLGTFQSNKRGSFKLSYYPATSPGEFYLVAPVNVSESQGSATVSVRRLRAGIAANVTLAAGVPSSGTAATAGVDYTALSTTLTFGAGTEEVSSASVPILVDDLTEGTERFGLALSAPTAGAVLGSPTTVDVNILDQSGTAAPSFLTGNMSVRENDGRITVPIQRNSGLGGAVRVVITAGQESDGAKLGVDYNLPSGTSFDMAPFQTRLDIPVEILNDGVYRGQRDFVLRLSSGTPGVSYGGSDITFLLVDIEDDDLLVPVPGRASAFYDNGGIAGTIDFTVSATGSVTGKVAMARGVFSFTGVLNAAGYLVAQLGPATGPLRTIQIQLYSTTYKFYLVTLNDGDLGSSITSAATVTNFTKLSPCPVAGKYTFVDDGIVGVPQQAAGLITVSPLGSATLSGKLFDGTALLANGTVDPSDYLTVGASLYAGKGRALLGTYLLAAGGVVTTGVSFKLLRPGRANQTVELPAIDSSTAGRVAKYVPPPANTRLLTVWSAGTGNADLTGGGFAALTTKALTISTANKVTVTPLLPEKLALTLTPATGMFTGTVLPTGATTPKAIYGFLVQSGVSSVGRGFFLNGITPGRVVLRGP